MVSARHALVLHLRPCGSLKGEIHGSCQCLIHGMLSPDCSIVCVVVPESYRVSVRVSRGDLSGTEGARFN